MYGRIGNSLVPRPSTGLVDLAGAEAMRDALVARTKADSSLVPTIGECVEKYLTSRKHELGEKTYAQQISPPYGVSPTTQ
jgi:hypothetical protein